MPNRQSGHVLHFEGRDYADEFWGKRDDAAHYLCGGAFLGKTDAKTKEDCLHNIEQSYVNLVAYPTYLKGQDITTITPER